MSNSASTLPTRDHAQLSDAESDQSTLQTAPYSQLRLQQLSDGDAEKAVPDSSPPATIPESDAPDGGAVAWLVVLGAWCTSFCSFGWLNSIGVFQEYYQNDLLAAYSPSTVAWIPSLQIFFMMGLGPLVGAIYDRHGPRALLIVGSFLHVFGVMMTSLGTEYYQILLAHGICSSIGASCIFQPSVTCAAGWFNKRRGAAFGVLFTGSSIGGVIFPIMVSHVIRSLGFGWAMRLSAFLMLFLLVIACLTVHPLHPPRPHPVTRALLVKPLREVQFLLVTAGFFFFSYGFFAPIDYLPVQALGAGMSPDLAQYMLPILNAGSLFGRVFAGFMADRLGRFNIFLVACYLSGIWILGLWLPGSGDAALIAFAVLFGFSSGAYVSLITPMVMAISPFQELGFRTGIVMLTASIGGLTTSPINGVILDSANGVTGLKVFSGVFCMVGTTFVLVARVRATGFKLWARF